MSWLSGKRWPEIRVRMAPVRAWRAPWIAQGWHWLITPRDCTAWWAKITTLPRTYGGLFVALVILLLLLPLWRWYEVEKEGDKGAVTYPHASLINPILGGLGALFLIYAAIRQARTASEQAETARKQAQIAADRHAAQTNADLQRRTTETFSKAVEQLGSEKMEVRVGGVYTLERLASEALTSPQAADATGGESTTFVSDLYWTVMETLTAFVRERTRPEAEQLAKPNDQRVSESAYLLWKDAGMPEGRSGEFWSEALEQEARRERPATDIAAVLEVLRRRPAAGRAREKLPDRRLHLGMTALRGANLIEAHLEGADLNEAHLERARLAGAHLEGADLRRAHLERTDLRGAHLEGAFLGGAQLEHANLTEAHLERANLRGAQFKRANLGGAHLECARIAGAHFEHTNLSGAHLAGANLRGAQLERANSEAQLERANLAGAHLEGANLRGAQLEHANLTEAHLEGADLSGAHLAGVRLSQAHLEGADLREAHLDGADLSETVGDAKTRLSAAGVERPTNWPPYAP